MNLVKVEPSRLFEFIFWLKPSLIKFYLPTIFQFIFDFIININLKLVLVILGRLSFGVAIILLIAATSMNREQAYGAGWLNGECYLVKGGTYAGSAILILVTVGSIIGSTLSTIKTNQADQGGKIHAQMG